MGGVGRKRVTVFYKQSVIQPLRIPFFVRFLYVEFAFLVSGIIPSCLTNSLLHLIFKGLHHWKSSNLQCGPGVGDYEVAFQTMLADTQGSARTMRPKLVGEIGLQHQRWNKFVTFFII
ncbi:uncharacterized protein LOC116107890 [Pistacia vera]|uniref:uncharacterized protein LOC116107890 n=1 Tax=Pistacia vera TaxID=55513 RepID=UPI0012632CD8|nr:uncharacterized protein LOC116107890 [Pistacia vera]